MAAMQLQKMPSGASPRCSMEAAGLVPGRIIREARPVQLLLSDSQPPEYTGFRGLQRAPFISFHAHNLLEEKWNKTTDSQYLK